MKSGHRVSIPNFIYWKLLLQCNHNLTSYFTTKKLDFQYRFTNCGNVMRSNSYPVSHERKNHLRLT